MLGPVAEREGLLEPADLPEHHCHASWWVLNRPLSRALAEQVAASDDVGALWTVAANPTLQPDIVDILSHHPEAKVRAATAGRADLTAAQVATLTTDPDPAVRAAVATRAGLTRRQITALAADPHDAVRSAASTPAHVAEAERAVPDGRTDLDLDKAVTNIELQSETGQPFPWPKPSDPTVPA